MKPSLQLSISQQLTLTPQLQQADSSSTTLYARFATRDPTDS